MEPKIDKTVQEFEGVMCEYTGSPYAVAVSSNTNGIFLVLGMLRRVGERVPGMVLTIPARTYYSVGMSIINAGYMVGFRDEAWSGEYEIKPLKVWDSATRLKRNMYKPGTICVLSTQYRKNLPIGRGGVILTDNEEYADYLRLVRMNGDEEFRGWNMYMTPEQAARGLSLMEKMGDDNEDTGDYTMYPDISGWVVWD